MENMEKDNIRKQKVSNILLPKLLPLTKDASTSSEFLLGNHLSDRIGTIETSRNFEDLFQLLLQHQFKKTFKYYQKVLEIKAGVQ